jgi:hypothetical protein
MMRSVWYETLFAEFFLRIFCVPHRATLAAIHRLQRRALERFCVRAVFSTLLKIANRSKSTNCCAAIQVLEHEFKAVEKTYGQNVLHLTLLGAYIRSLLNNVNVTRFLSTHQSGIFLEFQTIAQAQAL